MSHYMYRPCAIGVNGLQGFAWIMGRTMVSTRWATDNASLNDVEIPTSAPLEAAEPAAAAPWAEAQPALPADIVNVPQCYRAVIECIKSKNEVVRQDIGSIRATFM